VRVITVNVTVRHLSFFRRLVPKYYPSRSEAVRVAVRDGLRRLASGETLEEREHSEKMVIITINLSDPGLEQLENAALAHGYHSRSALLRAVFDAWLEAELEDWEWRDRVLSAAADATAPVPVDMRTVAYQRWAEEVDSWWA